MSPIIIGGIVEAVGKIADDLITSDKERLDAEIELRRIGVDYARLDAEIIAGQHKTNQVEASSANVFVSGARPAILWVGAMAMAWTYVAHPMLVWAWVLLQAKGLVPSGFSPPPTLESDALWVIVSGILGLGGFRSFEKVKGVVAR